MNPAADWRIVDGVPTTWFDAPSLVAAATLAGRVVTEVSAEILIDVRSTGARVRLDAGGHAEAVSRVASQLGLVADPTVLQRLSVVIESVDPDAVRPFWERVLDYATGPDGDLVDPSRRDPAVRFENSSESRPLRNRWHLDVVRPTAAVDALDLAAGSGAYGVCRADADGNEVDLVPGDALGDTDQTSDWQTVFAAMACYRVTSPAQQRDLAEAAAGLADEVDFPLLMDLRPGLVILDSGKDRWEADAHGLQLDFVDLASRLQHAARSLGAQADPEQARFIQLFLDAADVARVRAFWLTALGYREDRRSGVSDIDDPRQLSPVLVFQELDATDAARRRQRNRLHVELAVPTDAAPIRLAATLAAGGRLVAEAAGRWQVADPEDNELVLVTDS